MRNRFARIFVRITCGAAGLTALSLFSALALVLILYCMWSGFAPFKVTDPYDPRFNPRHFRFEDYTITLCIQKEALAKLFPIGTNRSFVDQLLVQRGGAISTKTDDGQRTSSTYAYSYQPHTLGSLLIGFDWYVTVAYGADDKVIDMRIANRSAYDFFDDCQFGKHYGRKWK